jgi:hypothetical protein
MVRRVIQSLAYALIGLAAALAVFGLVSAALGRPSGMAQVRAVGVVEALMVAQAAIAAVRVFGGTRPTETSTFLIYLLVSVCLLPIGLQFARAEPTRWGGAVVAVAAIADAVVVVRLLSLWGHTGG